MFERYTEKARRVVFFARYEASAAGAPYIDDEHLLLGLIREDRNQLTRFFGSLDAVEAVELDTREQMPKKESVSTSVDLPLSNSGKSTLAYAAEEAGSFNHRQIGTEHLLLGLLRQQDSLVARVFIAHGISLAKVRDIVAQMTDSSFKPAAQRDATQRARLDQPGSVEFVNDANDACLAKSELGLIGQVPRIGEEVILTSETSIGAYRVRDVTYVYLKASEETLTVPRKLAKIVIRVEPAGAVRGARWDAMT